MPWSSSYFTTEAILKSYCPEPCTDTETTKNQAAVTIAEAEVNRYLESLGIDHDNLPLTGNAITQEFKRGCALWVASVLYGQHQQPAMASKALNGYETIHGGDKIWIDGARDMIKRYAETYDNNVIGIATKPAVLNYQSEYVDNWAEPNDTLENMDD